MKLQMRFGDQLVEVDVPKYATDDWMGGQSAITYYPDQPDHVEGTEDGSLLEHHHPGERRRTGEADPPEPPQTS